MALDILQELSQLSSKNPKGITYTFLPNHDSCLTISNQELYNASVKIATYLKSIKANRPILLLFPPGLDFIMALYGCLISGNIAVPIALPKPQQTGIIRSILKNSEAQYILSDRATIRRYQSIVTNVSFIDIHELEKPTTSFSGPEHQPGHLAILQYTSGSTGKPKGVMVSYANLEHNIRAIIDHFQLNERSISFSWLPHYHDMGLIDGIIQPLISKCQCILTSPRLVIGRPSFWMECISKYKVTHTGGPNFFYDLCTEKVEVKNEWNLSSLNDLYISAEPVRINTLVKFADKFSDIGFSMNQFAPGYGLAEATLMVSCHSPGNDIKTKDIKLSNYAIEAVSLGKLIPDMNALIIHPKTNQLCSEGQPGEIVLTGTSITEGYWNNREFTDQTYHFDPDGKGISFLRTGDLGVLEENEIYIVGRIKDTLIKNGVNYMAEDLEYAISQCDDLLKPDSCLAFSHELGMKEEIILLIKIAASVSMDKIMYLKSLIRKTLHDEFGLVDVNIHFHHGPSYAKTTSGKIRRSYNKELFLNHSFQLVNITQ